MTLMYTFIDLSWSRVKRNNLTLKNQEMELKHVLPKVKIVTSRRTKIRLSHQAHGR